LIVIENLENNEQILLMYLADELPSEDRAEVEQMLASDASLARDWQALQALHATVRDGLSRLDEMTPMPVNTEFAMRQAARAMRQKLAQPKGIPATAKAGRRSGSWRWLYPTVAAASVAIIAIGWLDHQRGPTIMPPSFVSDGTPDASDPVADAQNANEADDELLINSFSPPSGADSKELKVAEEDARPQLASGDGMPQDEISQYLLAATGSAQ
jgi:anti-sigma factor RsiW